MPLLSHIRHLLVAVLTTPFFWPAVASATEVEPDLNALFDHQIKRLHASEVVDLRHNFQGQPLLIVNTASHCGYTGQFEGLEALHQAYKARGLKVIGFPSNSFNQEAQDEADTARVCFYNFGVTFDMFAPIEVRGRNAHPVFKELARQSRAPRWNFYKYLLDREGRVIASFASNVAPDAPELRQAIEALLSAP